MGHFCAGVLVLIGRSILQVHNRSLLLPVTSWLPADGTCLYIIIYLGNELSESICHGHISVPLFYYYHQCF